PYGAVMLAQLQPRSHLLDGGGVSGAREGDGDLVRGALHVGGVLGRADVADDRADPVAGELCHRSGATDAPKRGERLDGEVIISVVGRAAPLRGHLERLGGPSPGSGVAGADGFALAGLGEMVQVTADARCGEAEGPADLGSCEGPAFEE